MTATTAFVGRCANCKQAFKVAAEERQRGVVTCPSCGARYRVAAPGVAATTPATTTAAKLPAIEPTSSLPAAGAATAALPGAHAPGLTFSPGDVVAGRYRVDRFLAQGGMGAVYAARDLELGVAVALKTLHAWIAGDPQSLERFKREIQLARRVTHPSVCRIFDLGVHTGEPGGRPVTFYTMELVSGETLADHLRRQGAMRPEAALPLVEQMAAALAAAHAVGVIHRDFKSENVFLADSGGRVVVADFGIARAGMDGESVAGEESVAARLTGTGQVLGTPAYMSPEQLEGGRLGPPSDVYSLGLVLYEMVTGRLPFQADTAISTAVKRLTEAAPSPRTFSPDLDPRWESVILRCLERHPADRFQSPLDVAAALAPARPPMPLSALPSWQRGKEAKSRRRKAALAALLAVGLAAAAASAWWRLEARRRGLAAAIATRPSIAVLGFRNLTGQAESGWLSTALAEMLSTELSAGGGLRVIPGDLVARAANAAPAAGDVLAPDTTRRLRASLGADYLVFGSYTIAGPKLRLDLRLQDTVGGRLVESYAPEGSQEGLFEVVRDAGRRLQQRLGVEPAAEGFWAGRYQPEATRLYAEGVDRLRRFDAQGARDLLERAVAADPRNPVFRSALATAWSSLGYSENALAEAKHALDLATELPADERLAVEGRYRESVRDWPAAAAAYATLLSTHPDDVDVGLRLAAAQSAAGQGAAAAATLDRLRALPPPAGDDPRIHLAAAAVAGAQGSFAAQRDHAVRAATAGSERGLSLLVAEARVAEGLAERQLGNPARAIEAATEARRAYAEAGDRGGVAAAASVSAGAQMDEGDLESARSDYEEALQAYRSLGDLGGVARTTNNLAVVLRNRGALAEARGLYEEALTACRTSGDRVGLATTLNNLAALRILGGELGSAEQALSEALELRRAQGDRAGEASALANLGTALRLRGDLDGARRNLEAALALRQELGQKIGEGLTLVGLGRVMLEQAELAAAAERFVRALEICREAGGKPCEADALAGQGEVLFWQGELEGARDRHRQALALRETTGDRLASADSRAALARVELDLGDAAAAGRLYAETIPALSTAGALDSVASAQAQNARALAAAGNATGARSALAAAAARAMVSQARSLLVQVGLAEARLAVASKRRREAARALGGARDAAEKAGLDLLRLESETVAVELGLETDGVPPNARRETLLQEAQARGVGWVPRRLVPGRGGTPAGAASP